MLLPLEKRQLSQHVSSTLLQRLTNHFCELTKICKARQTSSLLSAFQSFLHLNSSMHSWRRWFRLKQILHARTCTMQYKTHSLHMQYSAHISKHTQQPLALADTIAISTLSLVVCVPFQKKNHLHNVCFPQTVWTTGTLCRFPAGKCFKLTLGNGPSANATQLHP